jgi:hypothetical protein
MEDCSNHEAQQQSGNPEIAVAKSPRNPKNLSVDAIQLSPVMSTSNVAAKAFRISPTEEGTIMTFVIDAGKNKSKPRIQVPLPTSSGLTRANSGSPRSSSETSTPPRNDMSPRSPQPGQPPLSPANSVPALMKTLSDTGVAGVQRAGSNQKRSHAVIARVNSVESQGGDSEGEEEETEPTEHLFDENSFHQMREQSERYRNSITQAEPSADLSSNAESVMDVPQQPNGAGASGEKRTEAGDRLSKLMWIVNSGKVVEEAATKKVDDEDTPTEVNWLALAALTGSPGKPAQEKWFLSAVDGSDDVQGGLDDDEIIKSMLQHEQEQAQLQRLISGEPEEQEVLEEHTEDADADEEIEEFEEEAPAISLADQIMLQQQAQIIELLHSQQQMQQLQLQQQQQQQSQQQLTQLELVDKLVSQQQQQLLLQLQQQQQQHQQQGQKASVPAEQQSSPSRLQQLKQMQQQEEKENKPGTAEAALEHQREQQGTQGNDQLFTGLKRHASLQKIFQPMNPQIPPENPVSRTSPRNGSSPNMIPPSEEHRQAYVPAGQYSLQNPHGAPQTPLGYGYRENSRTNGPVAFPVGQDHLRTGHQPPGYGYDQPPTPMSYQQGHYTQQHHSNQDPYHPHRQDPNWRRHTSGSEMGSPTASDAGYNARMPPSYDDALSVDNRQMRRTQSSKSVISHHAAPMTPQGEVLHHNKAGMPPLPRHYSPNDAPEYQVYHHSDASVNSRQGPGEQRRLVKAASASSVIGHIHNQSPSHHNAHHQDNYHGQHQGHQQGHQQGHHHGHHHGHHQHHHSSNNSVSHGSVSGNRGYRTPTPPLYEDIHATGLSESYTYAQQPGHHHHRQSHPDNQHSRGRVDDTTKSTTSSSLTQDNESESGSDIVSMNEFNETGGRHMDRHGRQPSTAFGNPYGNDDRHSSYHEHRTLTKKGSGLSVISSISDNDLTTAEKTQETLASKVNSPHFVPSLEVLSTFRPRGLLPFQLIQVTSNFPGSAGYFSGNITLAQESIPKNKGPQGNRPDAVQIGLFSSSLEARRVCQANVPPMWVEETTSCYICQLAFTKLRRGGHCRNCGHYVCSSCSNKTWPSTMVPVYYHNGERNVKICDCCNFLATKFYEALRSGDLDTAQSIYASGNVNTHFPFTMFPSHEYPVHCVAKGGNLELMKWLLEDQYCKLVDDKDVPLKTAAGLTVLAVAAKHGHVELMKYLIHRHKRSVSEITDVNVAIRALHVCLEVSADLVLSLWTLI